MTKLLTTIALLCAVPAFAADKNMVKNIEDQWIVDQWRAMPAAEGTAYVDKYGDTVLVQAYKVIADNETEGDRYKQKGYKAEGDLFSASDYNALVNRVEKLERKVAGMQKEITKLHSKKANVD